MYVGNTHKKNKFTIIAKNLCYLLLADELMPKACLKFFPKKNIKEDLNDIQCHQTTGAFQPENHYSK